MGDTIKKIGIRNDAGQYTYTEIGVDANNVDIDSTTLDQKISTIEEDITKKVDKVKGKGLSSNDFTDEHLSIVTGNITTGVKGDAETEYRIGNVNLTAENIGALPVDGTAKKATADANGNVIPDTYATKDELTDSNNTLASDIALNRQTLGYSKKNLLKNTATTKTANGITFTVNEDGSVTVNGTATADAYFGVGGFYPIPNETYIFTSNSGTLSINDYWKAYSYISGIDGNAAWSSDSPDNNYSYKFTPTTNNRVTNRIFIKSGMTVSELTFYPMIRSAEITDGTYEPYVDDVDTRLQKIDNSILNTLEEIDANTSEENIAGALAVKEISKKMQNEMEASSNWVDITDSCNFGFVDIGSAAVYMNSTLRLVSFWVAVNGNVNNQGTVFTVALLPSGSNPKILISSCDHTTEGVSVNILTDGVVVKSSHNMDVSIANARYSGLIAF